MHICAKHKEKQEALERMFAQDLNVTVPYLGYDFGHPTMVSTAGVARPIVRATRPAIIPDFSSLREPSRAHGDSGLMHDWVL